MTDINVIKNDGRSEPFMVDKLIASVTKTGLSVDEAKLITDEVSSWIKENTADGSITSSSIRDKIIETLEKEHPVEADNFKAYKKP